MRYVSLFSGIEAATVAWEPLGWEPVAFAEIEHFPCAVLAYRFPDVPNLGDVTKIDWSEFAKQHGSVDLVCGGSPCQSFSVAGKREGLSGASGLMWEYVRAVREIRPRYFVWENVPGALSSGKGDDFRCLLQSLDELGYGLAWRILDAQFFGVAQRRRRVWLVGVLGNPERAAEILFEPDGLRWDYPSSRDKRKELAGTSRSNHECDCYGFAGHHGGNTSLGLDHEVSATLEANMPVDVAYGFSAGQSSKAGSLGFQPEQAPTLRSGSSGTNQVPSVAYAMRMRAGKPGGGKGPLVQTDVSGTLATGNYQTIFQPICLTQYGHELAGTLTARYDSSPCVDRGQNVVCMASGQANSEIETDLCPAMAARQYKDPPIVVYADDETPMVLYEGVYWVVRRLMPIECERLQGFEDDWTKIPYRGKPADKCPDGPRYKALGNSWAVPCARWIGERLERIEEWKN